MRAQGTEPIDFVLPWVDGSDPDWIAEKSSLMSDANADDRAVRYRDMDTLRFWFRAAERFAPWVNRIHFVTWGHLPPWLNAEHPKLHIVRHTDYIPAEYLPTYSSHTIELNLHRIAGLAEQFVYFNDDTFLLRPRVPGDFFRNGLPRDSACMNPIETMDLAATSGDRRIFYIPYNDVMYLNRRYDMRACIRKNPGKWYSPLYGTHLVRNLLLSPWPRFVGFADIHLPQAFRKQSFVDAWAEDADVLDATCRNKLRSDRDVNQWYIRYRQLAEGRFYPAPVPKDAVYSLAGAQDALCRAILSQRHAMLCVHDAPIADAAFDEVKRALARAFSAVLPEKCAYERE